ncbi:unnamed protein product [Fusarium venenatum]|uniref:Uncharacterized protein n=1 Tax=Fusarium venenatum TaxID=56646 RepID=A0A2L2SZF0_9HYPO|nr:uncharacterized protein FVRRES_04789 [Fusarium venenatum]CEI60353.1 unnamed protein product [Fusarium venenatum]
MDNGLIVYESVLENIVLLVDNRESMSWNIDKLFRELEVEYWGRTPKAIEARMERYKRWKNWTEERRTRMKEGL